jgi:hypothetical protein
VRWGKNKKHSVGQCVGLEAVLLKYGLYVFGHLSKWFVFVLMFKFWSVSRLWNGRPTIGYNEKGLAFVGELVFRLPITEVDNCNIADVLFISQIYNVQPELKHNKEQMLRLYSSSPNNAKPYVGRSYFSPQFFPL